MHIQIAYHIINSMLHLSVLLSKIF